MSSLFSKQAERADRVSDFQVSAPVPPPPPAMVPRVSEPVARQQHDAAGAPADGRAHLDRGTKVEGKLSFDCPVWIDGEVKGEIFAKDTVTVGEAAVIAAAIHAASVVVAGKISGNIDAVKRIELRPTARVECDLSAPAVVIQEGAMFEGRCSMRSEATDRKAASPSNGEHATHRATSENGGARAANS